MSEETFAEVVVHDSLELPERNTDRQVERRTHVT
jgi:hypothetical protein